MREAAANEALREHVTRVGFDLTLSKTQIASLVYLDLAIRNKRTGSDHVPLNQMNAVARMTRSHLVGGFRGCIERGLVTHHYREPRKDARGFTIQSEFHRPLGTHYTITKAGRLMIGLLHECGLYEDYAGPIGSQLLGLTA